MGSRRWVSAEALLDVDQPGDLLPTDLELLKLLSSPPERIDTDEADDG